jgi:hypothetical protein
MECEERRDLNFTPSMKALRADSVPFNPPRRIVDPEFDFDRVVEQLSNHAKQEICGGWCFRLFSHHLLDVFSLQMTDTLGTMRSPKRFDCSPISRFRAIGQPEKFRRAIPRSN